MQNKFFELLDKSINPEHMTAIEKYCQEQGYKLAQRIDDKMALVIKPKPKWCPEWLYRAVIRDSVEIVKSN